MQDCLVYDIQIQKNDWLLKNSLNYLMLKILIILEQNRSKQKMKTFFFLMLIFSVTILSTHSKSSLQHQFSSWQLKHGITLHEYQARYRVKIFENNRATIEQHNNNPANSYQMGINQFTGYTQQEFQLMFLGTTPPNLQIVQATPTTVNTTNTTVNIAVNWTAKAKVSAIRSQGNCGGCWAFSSTGAIESANLIQSNRTISLSVQQLIDCSSSFGNMGCNGGWPAYAFNYIINQNITTEALYPYKATTGTCKSNGGAYRISSYKSPFGCSAMIAEVANRPITVVLDASNWAYYSSGVFNSCAATPTINHAVLLAGVDAKANWWIKNSWGTYWGQNGYITLAAGNTCGICNYPGYSPYY